MTATLRLAPLACAVAAGSAWLLSCASPSPPPRSNPAPAAVSQATAEPAPVYWAGSLARRYARQAYAAASPWIVAPCGEVTGAIVPHHFAAAPLTAAALAGIERSVPTVVLLVPDHRNASPHPISTSLAPWRTATGRVLPALRTAEQLVAEGLVAVDERAFALEHAVADLVPLIEQAFPDARLLPLRFRSVDCAAGLGRARRLGRALAGQLEPSSLVIAAVDFVHDKPATVARDIDHRSERALASLAPEQACAVEADCPLALAALLEHGRAAGARRFVRLHRADSHEFGATSADAVVSYLTGYLTSASAAPLSVLAVGDVMLGRALTATMRERADFRFPLARVAAPLAAADIAIANLEAQLMDDCPTVRRGLRLCADPRALETLQLAGFDVVSVANNHAMDFGREGLEESVARLRAAGIAVAGHDGPVWLERKGKRLAVLGYGAVKGPFRPPEMEQEIARASQLADAVVVIMHWGREGHASPSKLQQRLAATAASAGARLLLGTHPHALQPLARVDDTTVAFSLGNFVFDQREPPSTRRGAIGVFTLCDGRVTHAHLAPVSVADDGAPQLMLGHHQLNESPSLEVH